ncbi:MAG: ABC transporter permease [Firmicutes bacterium]|nr:ABC transporter permease [Bacillota bacterium]
MNMRLETNLRGAAARAYVRVVGANRELSWLLFEVAMPVLGTAAYVFIYRALEAPREYLGFVVLGGAMTAYWLNVLWAMASQFYWERQSGILETYMVTPISLMSILLGMAVGGMFQTSLRALSVWSLGSLIFGVTYQISHPWLGVGVFLVTLAALYGLGMLFASVFLLYGREAWHLSNLLQEPIYLVSGFYFPVKALGIWVAVLASFIPLTLGLDALRQVFFGGTSHGFLSPWLEAGLLTFLAALFILSARRALIHMEWLAKREGRLTLKWQ